MKDMENWVKGIPYEVAFWQSYYGNKKRRADLFQWSQFDKECELDNFSVADFIKTASGDNEPVILDVGSSLSYMFGNIINGKRYDIRYVDALSPFYNRILDRYHIDRPHIKFGMLENLSALFAAESVDLIHVRNALDHCCSPLDGILQALAVVRKNGVIYLNHHRNEAEGENYRGFHQFNFDIKNGELIIWNRDTTIDVADRLSPYASVEASFSKDGYVVAVITKRESFSPETASRLLSEAVTFTAGLTEVLMKTQHSATFSLSYHLRRLYCTLGHRTMRLLPYSLLNAIKRLVSR